MKRPKQSGRGVRGDLLAWGAGWRAGPFTQVGRTHFARGWESSTVDGPRLSDQEETLIRQRNNQSSFSDDGDVTCVCLCGDSMSESPRKAQMLKGQHPGQPIARGPGPMVTPRPACTWPSPMRPSRRKEDLVFTQTLTRE